MILRSFVLVALTACGEVMGEPPPPPSIQPTLSCKPPNPRPCIVDDKVSCCVEEQPKRSF